jgi:hypothetical protein
MSDSPISKVADGLQALLVAMSKVAGANGAHDMLFILTSPPDSTNHGDAAALRIGPKERLLPTLIQVLKQQFTPAEVREFFTMLALEIPAPEAPRGTPPRKGNPFIN